MAGFCVSGFVVQPSNPVIPPPPFIGPSTVVLGRFNAGGASVVVPSGGAGASDPFTGVSTGDVMVAQIYCLNNSGRGNPTPTSLVGYQPAGWSIVREDYNAAVGSINGPLYAGLMTHVVTAGETLVYTFTRPINNVNEAAPMGVSIVIAHNSGGIERTGLNAVQVYTGGNLSAPSVQTVFQNELVFVGGVYGTGSGSIITSVNGLPDAKDMPHSQANDLFYQFSTAGFSLAQPFTCANTGDAFSLYTIVMLPRLV